MNDLLYHAEKKEDSRGYLFEFIKSPYAGQVFVSKTRPGITRGNHYHHTKIEKFCVIEGRATIRIRDLVTCEYREFVVDGSAASIIANVSRDKAITELCKLYGNMGSGYPHDPDTIAFICNWVKKNKCLPEFARKSWETNKNIMNDRFQRKLAAWK